MLRTNHEQPDLRTLETARDLEATGIERAQAEAIAPAIGGNSERLETKNDVELAVNRIEALIATKADKADLYRALWIQGGGIVAILTALKFLP